MNEVWSFIGVLIVIVFALQITLYCKEKEYYTDTTPRIFKRQLNSCPKATQQYMGSTWPSAASEPWSEHMTAQKKQIMNQEKNLINCEKSWRDCHLFQNCEKFRDPSGKLIRSKCVPKKEAYYPLWLGKY